MKKYFSCLFKHWIPVGVAIGCLGFIVLVVNQQNLRMSANDPQVQIVEDTVTQLNAHTSLSVTQVVDISHSLSPFIILYDQQGQAVSSTGQLHNETPVVPKGVLLTAKANGRNQVTWQPEAGVRLATVTMPYNDGYVLVGRNLREVEMREDQQQRIILLGISASLIFSFVAVAILEMIFADAVVTLKKRK